MCRASRGLILLLVLLQTLPFNFMQVTSSSWLVLSLSQSPGLYLSYLFRLQIYQARGGVKTVGCFFKDSTMSLDLFGAFITQTKISFFSLSLRQGTERLRENESKIILAVQSTTEFQFYLLSFHYALKP